MLVKAITFFLIGMAVLAMFGRLRLPGRGSGRTKTLNPKKCPDCGAYVVGKGPCACKSR